jgi:5-methylcytosine-specific restriction endonuclease McrA
MYIGTTERTCTQCGATFRSGGNLTCNPCRTTDRECTTCGKKFRGRERQCYDCRASDRPCKVCGKIFHGTKRTCLECLATERSCTNCGRSFRGNKNICPSCSPSDRVCVTCGGEFRGTSVNCPRCYATDRECSICGTAFCGNAATCRSCRVTTRQCVTCGNDFRGDQMECATCRRKERQCITCGQPFKAASYLECGACSGRTDAGNHRRRALRLAAEVAGPVPSRVYAAITTSGPCVYCGRPATTVDHVRPLSRGGHEAAYNLAPACERCNKAKGAKLLTEWDQVRVAHGATHSPIVAAELERELAVDRYGYFGPAGSPTGRMSPPHWITCS